MKTVVIIRHAKSDRSVFPGSDFDRPLNKRGETDAPLMAERLKNRIQKLDAFVSSPAKRALATCKYFCDVFGYNKKDILLKDNLYLAPKDIFYEVIKNIDDAHDRIALFAHNPGITDFANSLCHGLYIDNMPTCALLAVEADIDSWKDFRTSEKKFIFFDYPKA